MKMVQLYLGSQNVPAPTRIHGRKRKKSKMSCSKEPSEVQKKILSQLFNSIQTTLKSNSNSSLRTITKLTPILIEALFLHLLDRLSIVIHLLSMPNGVQGSFLAGAPNKEHLRSIKLLHSSAQLVGTNQLQPMWDLKTRICLGKKPKSSKVMPWHYKNPELKKGLGTTEFKLQTMGQTLYLPTLGMVVVCKHHTILPVISTPMLTTILDFIVP